MIGSEITEPHVVLSEEIESMLGQHFQPHMIRRMAGHMTTVLLEHHRGDYYAAKAEARTLCEMGKYQVYPHEARTKSLPNLEFGRFRFDGETREWVVLNP